MKIPAFDVVEPDSKAKQMATAAGEPGGNTY
jgi:hypothetical protein